MVPYAVSNLVAHCHHAAQHLRAELGIGTGDKERGGRIALLPSMLRGEVELSGSKVQGGPEFGATASY